MQNNFSITLDTDLVKESPFGGCADMLLANRNAVGAQYRRHSMVLGRCGTHRNRRSVRIHRCHIRMSSGVTIVAFQQSTTKLVVEMKSQNIKS